MLENIYLDHNATTPVLGDALIAVNTSLLLNGNASSIHYFGRKARTTVEDARENVANLVGAAPSEVVFTSGGTESNNLALNGTERKICFAPATEHHSVLSGVRKAFRVPVNSDGLILLDPLETALKRASHPALVSIMLANNETGVIQPVREVCELAHSYGAWVHCDAVQAVGKIPCNFKNLGVDFLSISGHKIGGPQGVGALIVREGLNLKALNTGGGQERGRRSGTENLSGIAGFGAAALWTLENLTDFSGFAALRDQLEYSLQEIAPIKVFGAQVARIPNTSCLTMPGVSAETQVIAFDLAGIAVSSGAACSSGKVSDSHVLSAMGVQKKDADTAIRVSFGRGNTANHVTRFRDIWADLFQKSEHKKSQIMALAR